MARFHGAFRISISIFLPVHIFMYCNCLQKLPLSAKGGVLFPGNDLYSDHFFTSVLLHDEEALSLYE